MSRAKQSPTAKWLIGLCAALYPVIVYIGLQAGQLLIVALVLLSLAAVKYHQNRHNPTKLLYAFMLLASTFLAAWSIIQQTDMGLRFYPVIVSLGLLLLFARSLWQEQTVIEQLARLHEPDLPAHATPYLRRVTQIWCLFFIINAAIASYTVTLSLATWTLYNGLVSYLLMGTLMAAEYAYRKLIVQQRITKS